jgi:site-specific recombinase XerD
VQKILHKGHFKDQHLRHERAKEGYLLFEVIRPETIKSAFRKHFRACSIFDAHFHDIRKTFTTNSLTQGYSLESMKEWLGHEDIRTTQAFYGRVEFQRMAKEMRRVQKNL